MAAVASAALILLGATVGATLLSRPPSHPARSKNAPPTSTRAAAPYPYGSAAFAELVADSYSVAGEGSTEHFRQWLRDAYRSARHPIPGTAGRNLDRDLSSKRAALAALSGPARRTREDRRLAEWAHRFIKKAIPRFSLDRGYEFHNVVKYGERQCLLQSVLIAGLLQAIGSDAGIVMVYKNDKGQLSNNGHVVVLLRLPNGTALLVDASDATPFVKHQGLLVRAADATLRSSEATALRSTEYQYVSPVYERGSSTISRFLPAGTRSGLAVAEVSGLDIAFVRSQFWYYRGERAPAGVIASKRNAAGLAASRKYLEKSVEACPGNSLAVYMLGRTLLYQGDIQGARGLLTRANQLYSRYGWVPDGLEDALIAVQAHRSSM
jgi:hypothetical protein